MHTLRINYINYIYPRGLCIPSTWHVRKELHSEQDSGKRGMCLFFLFRNNRIYLSEMQKIKKKKKNLFLKCTRTSNRQKLSNTGSIKGEASRLVRTKSSKTTFEENITLFKQRLRNRGYLDNLINKTLSEVNLRERMSALQNQKTCKNILSFVMEYRPSVPKLKQFR